MNKLIGAVILSAAVVLVPLAAQAGQIQNRLNRQETRIYQGVKKGRSSRGSKSRKNLIR